MYLVLFIGNIFLRIEKLINKTILKDTMVKKRIIRKVWKRNATGQMLVTIPKGNEEGIKEGDYVEITKI